MTDVFMSISIKNIRETVATYRGELYQAVGKQVELEYEMGELCKLQRLSKFLGISYFPFFWGRNWVRFHVFAHGTPFGRLW